MRTSPHTQPGSAAPPPSDPVRDRDLAELVAGARDGDDLAWEQLYARYTPTLRGIARSYRLPASDVEDAVQTAWLRLVDGVGRVRDPAAVGGWLAITTRRECMRLLRGTVRECPSGDPALGDVADSAGPADPEGVLLASERRAILQRALATLPERQRELMALLAADSSLDYGTVGAKLAMPVGSIGPTRSRSLARLRDHPELHEFCLSSG